MQKKIVMCLEFHLYTPLLNYIEEVEREYKENDISYKLSISYNCITDMYKVRITV